MVFYVLLFLIEVVCDAVKKISSRYFCWRAIQNSPVPFLDLFKWWSGHWERTFRILGVLLNKLSVDLVMEIIHPSL
jgi:hypothetical protein